MADLGAGPPLAGTAPTPPPPNPAAAGPTGPGRPPADPSPCGDLLRRRWHRRGSAAAAAANRVAPGPGGARSVEKPPAGHWESPRRAPRPAGRRPPPAPPSSGWERSTASAAASRPRPAACGATPSDPGQYPNPRPGDCRADSPRQSGDPPGWPGSAHCHKRPRCRAGSTPLAPAAGRWPPPRGIRPAASANELDLRPPGSIRDRGARAGPPVNG